MTTSIPIAAATVSSPPLIIERFLRDRESIWRQIAAEQDLGRLIIHMMASSTVSLAVYGAIVGLAHSFLQAASSAIKLPALFLLTLAICLPTLYLFNLVWGGRLSAIQVMALALTTLTVSSALTVAFVPIALFFQLTAHNYPFFVLLNVSILTLSGWVGLSFLVQGTRYLNRAHDDGPPAAQVNMRLLYAWLLLYAFVGTQLGWTLRPFFGTPDYPFILFRPLESNFYAGVIDMVFKLLISRGRGF
ncbi:MAG: hypothetical protein WCI67_18375 [Chloroflexales bacterium]